MNLSIKMEKAPCIILIHFPLMSKNDTMKSFFCNNIKSLGFFGIIELDNVQSTWHINKTFFRIDWQIKERFLFKLVGT